MPLDPLKMPTTDAGKTSGENAARTRPYSLETTQHPSDSGRERLLQYIWSFSKKSSPSSTSRPHGPSVSSKDFNCRNMQKGKESLHVGFPLD